MHLIAYLPPFIMNCAGKNVGCSHLHISTALWYLVEGDDHK